MAQAGLNDEKTGSRNSRWTVPLKEKKILIFELLEIMPPEEIFCQLSLKVVLWIRIRMGPELLPGSGSGIIVPDPAKYEKADK